MAGISEDGKKLEAELKEVDQKVDQLRVTFEMYFQGIERQPPTNERDMLKRRVLDLRTATTRNTEVRFRINQLVAKFNTYNNYWQRVTKQIEDGTYHRDVFKAKYRNQPQEPQAPEAGAESEAPATKKKPAQGGTRRPGPGLSDDNVNAIYNAYMMAKRRCKENTKGLTKEALAASLKKQVPSIQKQYKCKTVEFKVVIKGGKAILKAVPKF